MSKKSSAPYAPPAKSAVSSPFLPVRPRAGEGHSITMKVKAVTRTGESGTMTFGIDLADAPVPSRRYAAELATVEVRDNELRLFFAQRSPFGNDFDSVLVMRLNPRAAANLIRSIDEMGSPSLEDIQRAIKVEPEPLIKELKNPVHPGNVANMVANFVAVAIAEFETCLDFYHSSAFVMGVISTKGSIEMEPKVRVDIRTALFISLISKIREISPSLSVN